MRLGWGVLLEGVGPGVGGVVPAWGALLEGVGAELDGAARLYWERL